MTKSTILLIMAALLTSQLNQAATNAPAPNCLCPAGSTQIKKGLNTSCVDIRGNNVEIDLWDCYCPTWAQRVMHPDYSIECQGG